MQAPADRIARRISAEEWQARSDLLDVLQTLHSLAEKFPIKRNAKRESLTLGLGRLK